MGTIKQKIEYVKDNAGLTQDYNVAEALYAAVGVMENMTMKIEYLEKELARMKRRINNHD